MLVERERDGRVSLTFTLIQHSRDELFMKSLVDYFGSGKAYTYKSYTEFKCQSFADNFEKVIPFFQKYPSPSLSWEGQEKFSSTRYISLALRRIF